MELVKTVDDVRQAVDRWREAGKTIGLVPTMGYLHEGHASLIRRAAGENDKVVVSIFVNPMQFGPSEDLDSYPRDIQHDMAVCRDAGARLIFHPDVSELYPDGFCSAVDLTGPAERLCGGSRPVHFRGVCTVVTKLFNIVKPHRAYFGQKDAQQLAVIRRMTADLNISVEIAGCPIVREPDGLAMSSRNKYLSPAERKAALCLSEGLAAGRRLMESGETNSRVIVEAVRRRIGQEKLARVDYIEVVDPDSIQPVDYADRPILCAAAVYIGTTRLIDNFTTEGS